MKIYTASATCDWGTIFTDERIKASGWRPAFARAAQLAKERARKRPREISIKLRLIGGANTASELTSE